MTSVSKEIIDFIQSLPRSKDGYMILDYYYHKESEPYTLQLLNMMYMGNGTITSEHLKAIPVTDEQEEKFNIEDEKIEYEINRYERSITRYEGM